MSTTPLPPTPENPDDAAWVGPDQTQQLSTSEVPSPADPAAQDPEPTRRKQRSPLAIVLMSVAATLTIVLLIAGAVAVNTGHLLRGGISSALGRSTPTPTASSGLSPEMQALVDEAKREVEEHSRTAPTQESIWLKDQEKIAEGWDVWEDGNIYWRDAAGMCSYAMPCIILEVLPDHGCPNRLYVEAAAMTGTAQVGTGNAMLGTVLEGNTAIVEVDFPNTPDFESATLTKITCD